MATNQQGIAITIKAWLPTGKTLDEQLGALTLVKNAHASGKYAELLEAAKIEAVQTDSKTRRIDETAQPQPTIDDPTPADQDDAIAERPALDEPDGTVTEPAVTEEEHPMTKALRGKKVA